jgi:hypothetical protein
VGEVGTAQVNKQTLLKEIYRRMKGNDNG